MKTKQQALLDLSVKLPVDIKGVADRLHRADNEVLGYGYSVTCIGGRVTGDTLYDTKIVDLYEVAKASTSLLEDNSRKYRVTNASCDCPDYATAYGNLCKHRLAIMLLEEMER